MRIIVVENGFDMSMCVCVLQNIVGLNIKLVQWTLRITDTLVHRLLSFIRGMSFIGVFYLSHSPLYLLNINFIANSSLL